MPDDMKISFPVDLTEAEQELVNRLGKRSKFYVFVRSIRHQLFDDAMQDVLIALATVVGAGWVEVAQAAEVKLVQSDQSVKAALDLDWNQPDATETLRSLGSCRKHNSCKAG